MLLRFRKAFRRLDRFDQLLIVIAVAVASDLVASPAHELAHEMFHRDERRAQMIKRLRETKAEPVSAVVRSGIALKTAPAAQDYIQLYEGDAKLLTENLEHIQQTSTRIPNAIGAEEISAPPA